MTLRKILREPLLHFLAAGLVLFGLYAMVSPGDPDGRRIEVSEAQVAQIGQRFAATWNRAPTAAELNALVEQQVRDEIVYREGRAMGLDRDDATIKRRVRQKYELISEDAGTEAATDAELVAWRRAHPRSFLQPGVVSFDQRFFADDAAATAALARSDPGPGQPSLLPRTVAATPLDTVARDFGAGFAAGVAAAPVGQWSGPIASGYGVHLVRVNSRTAPVLPPLAEIRATVEREWENDRRRRAREADYARLRAEYDVTIAGR